MRDKFKIWEYLTIESYIRGSLFKDLVRARACLRAGVVLNAERKHCTSNRALASQYRDVTELDKPLHTYRRKHWASNTTLFPPSQGPMK